MNHSMENEIHTLHSHIFAYSMVTVHIIFFSLVKT